MAHSLKNVFTWLDLIEAQPSMWLGGDQSLGSLEAMIHGYYTALGSHGLIEDVPSMSRHFLYYVHHVTGWGCSCGWAHAIELRHRSPKTALAAFFKLVGAYRKLRPTALRTVRLRARHQPTGRLVKTGLEGRMARPDQVTIMRYRPEPLHFLRLRYGKQLIDADVLMTTNGSYATSLAFAKEWVHDELQVDPQEWTPA